MKIYTAKEVAEILRIKNEHPENSVNRMCRQGRIRAFKGPGRQGWRIHERALEDALLKPSK